MRDGLRSLTLLASLAFLLSGCQTVYYDTMEKLGVHKREILVDRVEDAKEAQEEAKEQFASAFEEFLAVSEVDADGSLKEAYDTLQAHYDAVDSKAKAVNDRIDGIRSVAKALFKEWEEELELYANPEFRASSEESLQATRGLYEKLVASMQAAADRMNPVLDVFRDQTLFLKHNLNARAIAALNKTSLALREEVQALIEEMEASIEEANAFIDQMQAGQA